MSFLLFLLCGALGGALGGMGMGGGTALIPLLTLFCGVEQNVAQGVNLAAFLPMSAAALAVHAREKRLRRSAVLPLAVPALAFSAAFSLLGARLPAPSLRAAFAIFMIILGIFRIVKALNMKKIDKSTKKT